MVTFVLSVTFLTLFGLIEFPCTQAAVGALLYRDKRERVEQVTDRIVATTSRYMLGNLAISVICASVYGITAVILGLPYALALALIAGILDLIPNVGRSRRHHRRHRRALGQPWSPGRLRDRDRRLSAGGELPPPADDHRQGSQRLGFTVLISVLVFGSLFGIVGAIIGVPIAAAIQIVVDESTASRRALIAADDAARDQPA